MLKDKDIAAVMTTLAGAFMEWHLLDLEVPRGAKARDLAQYLPSAHQHQNLTQALTRAKDSALEQNAIIVVFGSFVTVSAYLSEQT